MNSSDGRPLIFSKAEPLKLAETGHDERWLQDQIAADPSILGLGDLVVHSKERRQSSGGRLDFLLMDPETETMYEVEVMLGRTDESHIIRTIEYWDAERSRWPTREHRAVIVAEEITNRFFNVIALFNRAIPMIAVQLSAFRVDDSFTINFTKVLDIFEPAEEDDSVAEPTDRTFWERKSNPESLMVFDRCVKALTDEGLVFRVAYNKWSIPLSGNQQIFARFFPKKKEAHCLLRAKFVEDDLDPVAHELEGAGITATRNNRGQLSIPVTIRDLDRGGPALVKALALSWKTVGQGDLDTESV